MGASLDEVIRAAGRKLGTVVEYLCDFIAREPPATIDGWVPTEIQNRVQKAAAKHGGQFLRPIFEELEQKVSYEMIKISLTFHSLSGLPSNEVASQSSNSQESP